METIKTDRTDKRKWKNKRIILSTNVFDKSLERIRNIYDNIPNVGVAFSGGKDSVIILELAIMVAKEKNRLPVPVMFLDQECEWQATIDIMKRTMNRKEVKPYWYQIPVNMTNSASFEESFLKAWDPNEKWIREKDPIAIHKADFKNTRFYKMVVEMNIKTLGDNSCTITGLRTEESPKRYIGLTKNHTVAGMSFGAIIDEKRKIFTLSPIYDWRTTDVWKAIHENNWDYCSLYDDFFRFGWPVKNMRVSSLIHEQASRQLRALQEIEPETYDKLQRRLKGVNTFSKMQEDALMPKDLPFMFKTWTEYKDYLLENLIDKENQAKMKTSEKTHFKRLGQRIETTKNVIQAILLNDYEGATLEQRVLRMGAKPIKTTFERDD